MKNASWVFLFTLSTMAVLFGCQKNASQSSGSSGTTTLSLSKASVKRGQTITITASGNNLNRFNWSVTPSTTARIVSGNGQAQAIFALSGTYTISLYDTTGASHDSCHTIIHVNDSVYNPGDTMLPPPPIPPDYDTVGLAGAQIKITPVIDSFSTTVLMVQTVNVYNCFPYLIYGYEVGPASAGSANINFYSVVTGKAGSCSGVTNPAYAYLFLDHHGYPNGTYPISVHLNGTIYSGTFTLTDHTVDFSWSYSSGVTLSPGTITRL